MRHPKVPATGMITHGVTGSGKSTVSRELADRLPAIWLRSDVERRRSHSRHADATGVNRGRYSAQARDAVSESLLKLTQEVTDSGFAVINDATFLQAAQRERFQALAAHRNMPFLIIDVRAEEMALRARLDARRQRHDDPSEADIEVLEHHLQTREPLSGAELAVALPVESGHGLPIVHIKRRCGRRS